MANTKRLSQAVIVIIARALSLIVIEFVSCGALAKTVQSLSLKEASSSKLIPVNNTSYLALCYHDLTNAVTGNRYSVLRQHLIEQFEYLKANDYHIIGVDDLIAAQSGRKPLPTKAVLLTIDDGLTSFYEVFFPLLKAYHWKAVFAVVGKWTDDGLAKKYEPFGNQEAKMSSWQQLKEMTDSGLVELASHSFDLHKGEVFTPQGNEAPAAGYFKFDPITRKYESDQEFRTRLGTDLNLNNIRIQKWTGKKPRVMVWPFGSFNTLSYEASVQENMPIQFILEDGHNTLSSWPYVRRTMVMLDTDLEEFAQTLRQKVEAPFQERTAHVRLGDLISEKSIETEKALDQLIERIRGVGVNTVTLDATASDGKAFFPNEILQMKSDLLSRVSHLLLTRTKVEFVYVVLPTALVKGSALKMEALSGALARNLHFHGLVLKNESQEHPEMTELLRTAALKGLRTYRPRAKLLLWISSSTSLSPQYLKGFDWVYASLPSVQSLTRPESMTFEEQQKVVVHFDLNSGVKSNLNFEESSKKKIKDISSALLQNGFSKFSYFDSPLLESGPSIADLRSIFAGYSDPFEYLDWSSL